MISTVILDIVEQGLSIFITILIIMEHPLNIDCVSRTIVHNDIRSTCFESSGLGLGLVARGLVDIAV